MGHADGDGDEDEDLAAGTFSRWLDDMARAIDGDADAAVPCDGCTACCTSSQFVHIEPDEVDALAHIPRELLFPAPMRPKGHVVMGYDENGHCPMLVNGACSIYEHRPRTCRTYDCRIFAATGVDVGEDGDKLAIARRVRRWRFDFPDEADRAQHAALVAAARAVDAHHPPTERAVLAIRSHRKGAVDSSG
jgi:Fe-S-cluster containining protein